MKKRAFMALFMTIGFVAIARIAVSDITETYFDSSKLYIRKTIKDGRCMRGWPVYCLVDPYGSGISQCDLGDEEFLNTTYYQDTRGNPLTVCDPYAVGGDRCGAVFYKGCIYKR